jgi:hypothetical protein
MTNGTIVDTPTSGSQGVFDVTFTPTESGYFHIKLLINGLDVDSTADYRT